MKNRRWLLSICSVLIVSTGLAIPPRIEEFSEFLRTLDNEELAIPGMPVSSRLQFTLRSFRDDGMNVTVPSFSATNSRFEAVLDFRGPNSKLPFVRVIASGGLNQSPRPFRFEVENVAITNFGFQNSNFNADEFNSRMNQRFLAISTAEGLRAWNERVYESLSRLAEVVILDPNVAEIGIETIAPRGYKRLYLVHNHPVAALNYSNFRGVPVDLRPRTEAHFLFNWKDLLIFDGNKFVGQERLYQPEMGFSARLVYDGIKRPNMGHCKEALEARHILDNGAAADRLMSRILIDSHRLAISLAKFEVAAFNPAGLLPRIKISVSNVDDLKQLRQLYGRYFENFRIVYKETTFSIL